MLALPYGYYALTLEGGEGEQDCQNAAFLIGMASAEISQLFPFRDSERKKRAKTIWLELHVDNVKSVAFGA